MARLDKILLDKNGSPIVGALVELVNLETGLQIKEATTDRNGRYSFLDIPVGKYQIRFYGSKLTKADWIQEIDVIEQQQIVSITPLKFVSTPTMSVFEDTLVTSNKIEENISVFTFGNLVPSEGELSKIVILYKKFIEITYATLKEFDFRVGQGVGGLIEFKTSIVLKTKPQDFDFKATFLNPLNEPAKVNDNVLAIEPTGGNPITFDGISDFDELVAIKNLICKNTQGGNAESGVLKSFFAELVWDDLRKFSEGSFPINTTDARGNNVTITFKQAQRIIRYVVFIFVSDDGNLPDNNDNFPGSTIALTNGAWFWVGDTIANTYSVKAPPTKKVAFWVGMEMEFTKEKSDPSSVVKSKETKKYGVN